jgi:toxin ParE1/3/4
VRSVVYSPEAQQDLRSIFDYIRDESSVDRAADFVRRIQAACDDLALFPHRGTARDDLPEGVRVIGYAKRVSIAFRVDQDRVTIARVLYGGRDLASALRQADETDED